MAVQVIGTEKVCKSIEKLSDSSTIVAAFNQACLLVEDAAKRKVPTGPSSTGALRASIQSEVSTGGTTVEGVVFSPLQYAPYVEYGTGLYASGGRKDVPWRYQDASGDWHTTSGMKPRPFMVPALNENRAEIARIIKGAICDG